MPDQSSASTEHALMQEITAPLATLPDDPVPIAASVDFPGALRGYDRIAVDAYVQKTSQLVAELQATRSPEAAVRRALERVGEEVSGILQRAHDTAAQITAQSRSEAEDRLEAARREAAQIVAGAEARVRELDADTDRIWAERHRIVEDTRGLARELLALTDTAAERFPADDAAEPEAPGPAGTGPVAGDEAESELAPAHGLEAPVHDLEGSGHDAESADYVDTSPHDVEGSGHNLEGSAHEVEGADVAPGRSEDDRDVPELFSRRADEDPDIESTAILPTVEPPRGDGEPR